ncbi:hypothetical protein CCHR01_11398 [Colletotrichum chrysophilum]|uniref:Uncharacterized protein n=1 Tax=Colletotrichum chrysophilum TaxID=1836956 RepID=A0AAD9ECD5_9PEZI|nr:hypothetical protein CCHR01_11398 [Colletotrichum chrysophilum]
MTFQLRLNIRKQRLLKLAVLARLRSRLRLPNRAVVLPTLRFRADSRPDLGQRALLNRRSESNGCIQKRAQEEPRRGVMEVRRDHAGVHGDNLDTLLSLRQGLGVVQISQFGNRVALRRRAVGHRGAEFGKVVNVARRHRVGCRSEHHDACFAVDFGGLAHGGEEQLGEERGADDVGAELDLVAVFREALCGHHDTCVVDEDVEAGFLGEEGGSGGFHALEGCEVELEEADILCGGVCRLDVLDGLLGFLLRPGGEVDAGGIAGCELLHRFEPQSCVSAGDDDDLVFEFRNIFLAKLRHDGGVELQKSLEPVVDHDKQRDGGQELNRSDLKSIATNRNNIFEGGTTTYILADYDRILTIQGIKYMTRQDDYERSLNMAGAIPRQKASTSGTVSIGIDIKTSSGV